MWFLKGEMNKIFEAKKQMQEYYNYFTTQNTDTHIPIILFSFKY